MQQIEDNTTAGQWCYIPTKKNPADSALRGLNASQVNSIDCWFQGLPFCGRISNISKVEMSLQSFQMISRTEERYYIL